MITWKEFKESVEKQGLKDEMTIDYIDWDGYGLPEANLNDPEYISILSIV